jgi:polar amino acid transport system substrate-binding protein
MGQKPRNQGSVDPPTEEKKMNTFRKFGRVATLVAGIALASGAAMAQGLIKEIMDRGTLRIGVAESPPYQFPDTMSGEYVGLNIDLAKEVAEIMGVELEVVPASWATLITGLEVNQYDVVMANLFATPQRALSVAFSDPFDTYGFHVMVKADSPIQSLDELNSPDISFAGVVGTVEAQYPKELYPEVTVNELVTDQANAGPNSVISGNSDAYLVDPGYFRVLSSQNPNFASQVRLLNDENNLLKQVSLSYALRPENTDMMGFLNVFLQDKVANGVIVKMRDEWFDNIAAN